MKKGKRVLLENLVFALSRLRKQCPNLCFNCMVFLVGYMDHFCA